MTNPFNPAPNPFHTPLTLTHLYNQLNDPLIDKTIDYDITKYISHHQSLFPELSLAGSFNRKSIDNINIQNKLVSIKSLKSHCRKLSYERYQDRNFPLISTFSYNNSPFLILRNTSREGDTYPNILITDFNLYKTAVSFLFGLMEPDDDALNEPRGPLSGSIPKHLNFIPPPNYSDQYIEKALNHLLLQYLFV